MNTYNIFRYSLYVDLLKFELLKQYQNNSGSKTTLAYLVNKDYEILAQIIQNKLEMTLKGKQHQKIGAHISGSTLERLMRYNQISFHSSTLNKLSIFLGYNSWIDFMNVKQINSKPAPLFNKKLILETVKNAIQYEIDAYYALPKIDFQNLGNIYAEFTTRDNLYRLLVEYQKKKWILKDLEFSQSPGKIFKNGRYSDFYVMVGESWNFTWHDTVTNELHYEDSTDTYFYSLYYEGETNAFGEISPVVGWRIMYKRVLTDAFWGAENIIKSAMNWDDDVNSLLKRSRFME